MFTELAAKARSVSSKQELVEFIRLLLDDFARGARAWNNSTLPSFLEASAGWLGDSDGYYRNLGEPIPDAPSWRMVAEMLLAATLYE